ncbi:glycoside hydrolase family 43 protein [Zasmidium cellare ATCC 36951]|uniref:Glycoside hydrolase family 43 protein n=1 Tax=Zasmidium cellare ATCC 36951 TaxID=1080233 RepID=A0A6A6C692_ZASCE|nr:glycoside hydrolase family 43 protein [Zasmidium cellare ATCC 36951]KAF2162624.1 glycoside hydrolase family 43 protein [Zasmidium cellare ATCC 36951]
MLSLSSSCLYFIFAFLQATVWAADYSNPLKGSDAGDPNIVYEDGWYYLMATGSPPPVLQMTRARTLDGLKAGEVRDVWRDSTPSRCCNLWAPEMHLVDGRWHIYYAAGPENDPGVQRSHVLQGGTNLWDEFQYLGQIREDYSVDGTLLTVNDQNYYVYACRPNNVQSLCIAPRTSPSTTGDSKVISSPTEEWESRNSPLNEGPYALYHEGNTWLSFSAGTCDSPTYSLGLLKYNGGDPMEIGSWSKTGPVFSSANGNYGTGHNSFFTSPDGSETWNVWHSVTNSSGGCGSSRSASSLIVKWNDDGSPNLGEAPALGTVLQGPSGEPEQ